VVSAIISAVTTPDLPDLTRRELLAGAGAAALLLDPSSLRAQPAPRTIVFRNTTVVNPDAVQNDVALAVTGATIAAIGQIKSSRAIPTPTSTTDATKRSSRV
jgi:hypothetical protein